MVDNEERTEWFPVRLSGLQSCQLGNFQLLDVRFTVVELYTCATSLHNTCGGATGLL